MIVSHGFIFIIGLIVIGLVTKSSKARVLERKQTEDELLSERNRLQTILDVSPSGIYIVDQQHNIEYINPVIEKEFGPVDGQKCYEYLCDRTESCPWCKNDEVFAGKSVRWEWYSFKNDKYYDLFDTPLKNPDGSISKFEIFYDITDRKKAEDEAIKSKDFMDKVLEGSKDGIIITDEMGASISVNRAIEQMTGFKRDDIIGKHVSTLIPPDKELKKNILAGMADLFEKGFAVYDTMLITVDNKQIDVEVSTTLIKNEKGDSIAAVSVFRDITERKSMDEKLRQTQKLESLGVLAGGIAHDFNNILMAILGNADLALLELSPVSPARQNVLEIEKATRRAADLCKQMLAYSGKGRFVIEAINLGELIQEMIHMLEVSVSKKAVLRYNFADNLPAIKADIAQIRQIIMNMIINASEAIGDKSGVISVNIGAMDCDSKYLNEIYSGENLPEGIYVYLEIADTGCGMDKEATKKLFEPFFTTKFTGRGLGMSAVLGIVQGHKGAIKVYSEKGRGTTFKVLFPAVDDPAGPVAKEVADKKEWQGSGTVMIVDDEESICAVGKQMLERIGFKVIIAPDGREAVELFRKHAEDIVCVILDLTMPHMDGEETFRELRRIRKDVCVILSSGYNEQDITQRFVGKDLAGFIQKPYQSASLIEKVREVLEVK